MLNLGAGMYYEVGMSGGVDYTDVTAGTAKENMTYANAGIKHNDYGALGSLQFKFPMGPLIKTIIDARYIYGLTEQNIDASSISIKNRYIQVLAGLGFGF